MKDQSQSRNDALTKLVTDAQDILATYIVPDSGISDQECINRLLGLLDGPQSRAALAAPLSESGERDGFTLEDVHKALHVALTEAGIKNEVQLGQCIVAGLESLPDGE